MKVNVKYGGRGDYASVQISIDMEDSDSYILAFGGTDRLSIPFQEISSSEALVEKGVEFVTRYNDEYCTGQIVPIGLLELVDWYMSRSVLNIRNIPVKDYYLVDLVVNGVLEAITLKHKGIIVCDRFRDNAEFQIDIGVHGKCE